MDSFFSRYKNGLVLGLVLLAQVIGLAIQVRRPVPNAPDGRGVRLLRYWMISVVGPPERIVHATGLGIRSVWSNYFDLRHTRQRNRELQAEVDRLRLEQAGLAEDARQGHRLQQLLAFREHYIYKTLPAQVVGTSGTDMSRIILIDKGAKDGLQLDMPVITPDGIVGKVREVFPHMAQVLEISDQSSGAGVILEKTRIRGVLRGNAYGQPQIINILPDERIQPGERVLTSGGDKVYPRGMTVGYVDKVVNDPERNPYIDIVIKPAAALSQLEEVLVITTTSDVVPPGEEADIAESQSDASKHSAADVLGDKLPGLKDPNDPNAGAAQEAAEAATGEGDVARPVRPPSALHADRFTPGTTPAADTLTPAQAMPHPPHNPPPPTSPPASSSVSPAAKPEPTAPAIAPKPTPGTSNPATLTPVKKPVPAAGLVHPPTGAPGSGSTISSNPAKTPANASAPKAPAPAPASATRTPPANSVTAPGSQAPQAAAKGATDAPNPGDGTHTIVNDGPIRNRPKPATGTAPKNPVAPGTAAPSGTKAAPPAATPVKPPKPKPAPSQTSPPKTAPQQIQPPPNPAPPQGGR